MKSHTIISFGDVHSNKNKLEEIANFIENSTNSIDSIINVGDLIGNQNNKDSYEYRIAHEEMKLSEDLEKEIQRYNQQVSLTGQKDETKVIELNNNIREEQFKFLKKLFEDEYKKIIPEIQRISNLVGKDKFLSITGNHDSVLGYDLLKDYTSFVEEKKKLVITSANGLELIVRGTINSAEALKLQQGIREKTTPENYKLLFYNHENYLPNKIKEMNDSDDESMAQFDESENKRLEDFKSDIMLAHKLPFYAQDEVGSCSQAVKLFDNKQVSAYGGHFHGAYIAKHNNTFSFNGGTKYFVETKYIQSDDSSKKEVDYVIFRKYQGKKAA